MNRGSRWAPGIQVGPNRVEIQGHFKYLGSITQGNGGQDREIQSLTGQRQLPSLHSNHRKLTSLSALLRGDRSAEELASADASVQQSAARGSAQRAQGSAQAQAQVSASQAQGPLPQAQAQVGAPCAQPLTPGPAPEAQIPAPVAQVSAPPTQGSAPEPLALVHNQEPAQNSSISAGDVSHVDDKQSSDKAQHVDGKQRSAKARGPQLPMQLTFGDLLGSTQDALPSPSASVVSPPAVVASYDYHYSDYETSLLLPLRQTLRQVQTQTQTWTQAQPPTQAPAGPQPAQDSRSDTSASAHLTITISQVIGPGD